MKYIELSQNDLLAANNVYRVDNSWSNRKVADLIIPDSWIGEKPNP